VSSQMNNTTKENLKSILKSKTQGDGFPYLPGRFAPFRLRRKHAIVITVNQKPMTDQHPITPPPELLHTLCNDATLTWMERLELAYVAGADCELDACCDWLEDVICDDPQDTAKELRAARRPKPPSLKEQALEVLGNVQKGWGLAEVDLDTIRLALEQLDD
jgi:hypothetical protein